MNIEDLIQIEANKLFNAYLPYYIKHFNYRRNKFSLEPQRKYFIKASQMFCVREGFDAEKLIASFMIDSFKWPAQLPQENVWKTYINYIPGIQSKKTKDEEVVEQIVNAAIELRRYGTVKEWLDKKINQRMVETNKMKFSPILFAFSNSFNDFCRGEYYNLSKLRNEVFSCENKIKIISKIKSILGEDYYD